MNLLRWPRRSLLYAKVAIGATLGNNANTPIIHVSITSDMVAIPAVLTLRYFCAYSALCPRRGYTWGVAPGSKLQCVQRVLRAETLPPRPKYLRSPQTPSRKMKRLTFRLLMTAPSSLKTTPGNVTVGLHENSNISRCYGVAPPPHAFRPWSPPQRHGQCHQLRLHFP